MLSNGGPRFTTPYQTPMATRFWWPLVEWSCTLSFTIEPILKVKRYKMPSSVLNAVLQLLTQFTTQTLFPRKMQRNSITLDYWILVALSLTHTLIFKIAFLLRWPGLILTMDLSRFLPHWQHGRWSAMQLLIHFRTSGTCRLLLTL